MGAHLEIMVLAVGQGSCNLVKEYNENDELIYLALLDCGREKTDTTMKKDIQQNQMEVIREQMRERGKIANVQYGESVTDLYLDHMVLSHRDVDHMLFLTEEYLYKGLVASQKAMQKTDHEQYEKIRLRYKVKGKKLNRLENGRFILEMEDLNVPHVYRLKFMDPADLVNSTTAAEYEYREQGNIQGESIILGAPSSYQGEFSFDWDLIFRAEETEAYLVDHSMMVLTSQGESTNNQHETELRVEFEHSTSGMDEAWIWSIELHDNRWEKAGLAHTDIFYDIKVSLTLLSGEYVIGAEATVHYEYAGYGQDPEGGFSCSYNNSEESEESISIYEVMEHIKGQVEEALSDTTYCPEYLRQGYLEWTEAGFVYLQDILHFFVDTGHKMIENAFEVDSAQAIFDYILENLPEKGQKNEPDTLLIGNIYVGGNKPGQTSNLAKNAILNTLQYSMNFYDEVAPKADMLVSASITNKDGQTLDKWYRSDLYLLRMPAQYYYNETGSLQTKDTYNEYAQKLVKSNRNAIRKANENDCSIFCVFHYPSVGQNEPYNLLVPGDATQNTMHHIIGVWKGAKQELKDCRSMMVAPHHGSFVTCKDHYRGETTKGVLSVFVSILNTDSMIISAGCPSHFCHPHNSFIKKVCEQMHVLSESSYGLYYNMTDKGRGARVNDYAMGMTRRYLVSTAYYEYDGKEEKFHYVNLNAVGSANIQEITYVQELEDTVLHRNDLEELYGK